MPIYLDPSETTPNTRMPQSIIQQSEALPGLEAVTGADFLITTHKITPGRGLRCDAQAAEIIAASNPDSDIGELAGVLGVSIPDVLAIRSAAHAIHNGVLVQRKSGGDFISSIPDLRDIRNRMLRWTWRSWLLVTGDFDTHNGHVVVDGHETGYSPESVNGAIESWRFDGGQVDVLASDSEIGPWINATLNRLRVMEIREDNDGRMRRYRRIIPDRDDGRARALAVLATLKGVGETGASKLLDYYGNLAAALEACLDPTIPKSKHRPGGVLGETTVRANRELFGLEDGFAFCMVGSVTD